MEYTIGTRVLGDWTIVRAIGEGSFGQVFEIQKTDYGITTRSALKVIRVPRSQADIRAALSDGMDEKTVTSYFQGFVEEIVKEIAIMSSLKSHPGVVSCEDHKVIPHAGTLGWDILIRMELLQPLTDYQLSHTIDEAIVRKLALDLTSALAFCQTKALIHRDIKPENIFVSETGQFKLGDFGVARTAEKTTGGLSKKGTESYMAPEVYLAQPYGASVDIYSLGLVLYKFMNHNRLPFLPAYPAPITFADRENSMVQRMQGVPIPPPAAASPELTAIIQKACAFNPHQRYQTAAEMLADLQKLSAMPISNTVNSTATPAEEPAAPEQTVGIWGHSVNEPTEGTVGIWGKQTSAQTSFDRPEPPEPSFVPSQSQPSYVPPTQSTTPTPPPTEPPIPSYIPTPPQPKKSGPSKGLIAGIAAAALVVIVAVVVIAIFGSGSDSGSSYTAQQESYSSYYNDSSEESSAVEESIIEESIVETLVLDADAQLWDDAMTQMFDPAAADYLTAGGLDLLSSYNYTPDTLATELVANGFLFLQEDGTYGTTPHYFDAYHKETGSADLKYYVAVPPGGHYYKRTVDVGKIYVVTDPQESTLVYVKWIWNTYNAETEAILGDSAFTAFLPWAETLGTAEYDEVIHNESIPDSMHRWLKEQPDGIALHQFDLQYFTWNDPENEYDEINTLMIVPNEKYLASTGHSFACIDITCDDITDSKMAHSLTITYDSTYDPLDYYLADFWDLKSLHALSDEEFEVQWTAAHNSALEHLDEALSVSNIDYNAALSDLYATFQAQADNSFGMSELLSDDSGNYFAIAYNSATILIFDAKNPTSGSFQREILFYYDPSCDTASYDLAFINSYLPPVGYTLGQTPLDAFASFGISRELYESTSETIYCSWEADTEPLYSYSFTTDSTFYAADAAYYTDSWIEKDVIDHRTLRMRLDFDSATWNQVKFDYGYFNGANEPTVYMVCYRISR